MRSFAIRVWGPVHELLVIRLLLSLLLPAILAILPLAATIVAPATAATEPVPSAAQEAFDRGVLAAEQQWLLAIRYFHEARKAAPAAPDILFNLGLAHAKAGQELPAIAWLHAYLAAAPHAPAAPAIRKEIVQLEVATEAKIGQILREARSAAAAVDKLSGSQWNVKLVAHTQASTGDIDGALRAGLTSEDAWRAYAHLLAYTGLIERAEEALSHVSEAKNRDDVYTFMANALINPSPTTWPASRRVFDLARAAAARIQDPGRRAGAFEGILTKDFRPGDVALAEKTLVGLRTPGVSIPTDRISYVLIAMLKSAIAAKDFDGARGLAERLLKLPLWGMPKVTPNRIIDAVTSIPAAQLAAGDTNGARTTATRLLPLAGEPLRAALEAVLGNDEPARVLAKTLSCDKFDWERPPGLLYWVIAVHVLSGDLPGARALVAPAAALCPGVNDVIFKFYLVESLLEWNALRGAISAARVIGGHASLYTLTAFIRRATTAEDLVGAEQAIPDFINLDSWQAKVRLALADAHERRQAVAEAARLRLQVARYLLAKPGNAYLFPSDAIAMMARVLETSGDSRGASTVSALTVLGRPSPEVEGWAGAARRLASETNVEVGGVADLGELVKKAAELKPSDAYSKLAVIAHNLAYQLFALRARALRLGP